MTNEQRLENIEQRLEKLENCLWGNDEDAHDPESLETRVKYLEESVYGVGVHRLGGILHNISRLWQRSNELRAEKWGHGLGKLTLGLEREIDEIENWLRTYKECQEEYVVRFQEGRLYGLKFCMQLLVHGEPKSENIEPKTDKQESEICRICGLEIDLSKPDDWTFENLGSGKVHRWCWGQKFKDYMNW